MSISLYHKEPVLSSDQVSTYSRDQSISKIFQKLVRGIFQHRTKIFLEKLYVVYIGKNVFTPDMNGAPGLEFCSGCKKFLIIEFHV